MWGDASWLLWLIPTLKPLWVWVWTHILKNFFKGLLVTFRVQSTNNSWHLYQSALGTLLPNNINLKEKDKFHTDQPDWFENKAVGTDLVPAYGTYWFKWKGVRAQVKYSSIESGGGGSNAKSTVEFFDFTFFTRKRKYLKSFREHVASLEIQNRQKQTTVWTSRWSSWVPYSIRPVRPENTLFYDNNIHHTLSADLKQFRESKEAYHNIGALHKRAYLIHGPPGNGKTTLVLWLAAQAGLDVAILPSQIDDAGFLELLNQVPKHTAIIMEDVDVLFAASKSRDGEDKEKSSDGKKVSLSLLLNVLDGPLSKDGLVCFLTTNYFEKLDAAFTRSGRINKVVGLGLASTDIFKRIFKSSYGKEAPESFISKFDSLEQIPSIADLERHFQEFDAENAEVHYKAIKRKITVD